MTITTAAFVQVNVGSEANDGTGASLRNAFITVNENFANISDVGLDTGDINCQGSIEVDGYLAVTGNVNITNSYVPTANTSPGTAGQIVWDTNHLYICVATNTWKRANISTW